MKSLSTMGNTNEDAKPAAASVATNASTPDAVHVDASSIKGQEAFQKTKVLTEGPKYNLEDDEKPYMEASKDPKPPTTSVADNASIPGAVDVDISSMKGQQAFQKTKDLTDGPKYYPEDDRKLLSGFEPVTVSSKRASGKSSKQSGKVLLFQIGKHCFSRLLTKLPASSLGKDRPLVRVCVRGLSLLDFDRRAHF